MDATARTSTTALWIGRVMTGLFVLFMLFDVGIKLLRLPIVDEAMNQLGYPPGTWFRDRRARGRAADPLPHSPHRHPRHGAVHRRVRRRDRQSPAGRRSAVQPRPVRRLSRRDRVGRTVVSRCIAACASAAAAASAYPVRITNTFAAVILSSATTEFWNTWLGEPSAGYAAIASLASRRFFMPRCAFFAAFLYTFRARGVPATFQSGSISWISRCSISSRRVMCMPCQSTGAGV